MRELKPVISCGELLIRLTGYEPMKQTRIISCRATVRQNKKTGFSQTP
jgi:hypothetical protein